ncbi:hypothetical protein [Mesorhizobium sp. NZP2077]|uniref:hypothetical protein n=1 Tax=Mesorhizobium sp. NZP2077 TaxID=2483404 RepID=UPI001555F98E|nr:hypothetical protein [Mesorhizobium sp. NZP2077]QKC82297.1 hypothetical protein EB232_12265 [Mesorhizobium sp. NZP2077]QKD15774.1 hypothetical protein HGP13_12070 [Mesorhizobium sp. NZP2077]
MSDSETAPAHTAYGGTAVVMVNVATWLLAFLLEHFVPEQISTGVAGTAVLSGTIGGGLASANSLKNAGLMALVGMVSTTLLLSLFVPLTSFRLGMAVGGIGTSFYAILSFTGFYTLMFLLIFAIESAANWLGRRRDMRKAEHD